jgi:serine/threonine protein kinase
MEVAVKRISGPGDVRQFENEVAVMANLRHKNVVQFLGWMEQPQVHFECHGGLIV